MSAWDEVKQQKIETILRDLVTRFTIEPRGERGPYGTLMMAFHPSPLHTFWFAWARNSYDEAALGELAGVMNEARRVLGIAEVSVEPKTTIVVGGKDDDGIGLATFEKPPGILKMRKNSVASHPTQNK